MWLEGEQFFEGCLQLAVRVQLDIGVYCESHEISSGLTCRILLDCVAAYVTRIAVLVPGEHGVLLYGGV